MAEVPELHAAQLAAAYYGERQGGDLHDFVRVTPNRVLFGLLDMAGRLEENSAIVSAAQQTFRTRSPELFSADDVNEADAMAELCLELNRAIMAAEGGIRSCPPLPAATTKTLAPSAISTPATLRDCSAISPVSPNCGHGPAPGTFFSRHLRGSPGRVAPRRRTSAGFPRSA